MRKISIVLAFLATICLSSVRFSMGKSSTEVNDVKPAPNGEQLTLNNKKDKLTMDALGRTYGYTSTLWEPVTEIEDGSVYMIRSTTNPNLVWDLTGGSLNNGTQVQLYETNYSQAQKFYIKKQFDVYGYVTYRFSPLYAYDKVLRVTGSGQNAKLKIDDEQYSAFNLFSDKFAIHQLHPSVPTRFAISACANRDTGMKLTVNSVASGQKIITKEHSAYVSNMVTTWEFIKTDYVGLHVANKTYINGQNETRYVARVPHAGKYVIETKDYNDGANIDTYVRLVRDSDGMQVAQNDDINYPSNANSKITYTFQTVEEFSIYVRGYSSSVSGYCRLILRPYKTIYLSSVFDLGHNNHDYTKHVNQAKPYLRNMGYFPEVETNINPYSLFTGMDWENTYKIQRDYYIHRDHGGPRTAGYFDGETEVWVDTDDFPSFAGTGVAAWIMCSGADQANGGAGNCPARQAVINGAQYSFGFRDSIYTDSGDLYIKKFCEALQTKSLEDSIIWASQECIKNRFFWLSDGISQPSLFLNGGATEYRYTVSGSSFSKTVINY